MILTWAEGSSYYRVDEEGRIYTGHPFDIRPYDAEGHTRSGFLDGERPPAKAQRYSQGTIYWLPTGQQEKLNFDQELELVEARQLRDELIVDVEVVAVEIELLEGRLADLG